VIAGLNPNKQMDLITILTSITWFGPKPGVYPASPMMTFKEDGSVEIGDFLMSGEAEPGYAHSHGTYRVEGKTILIDLNDPDSGPRTIQAVFENGVITFPNGEFPQLTDDEDPCSA
jgi:hypothetical protein